jgi:hypothetical protein
VSKTERRQRTGNSGIWTENRGKGEEGDKRKGKEDREYGKYR